MPLNKELPIAISMGEPGGINIEIILKCIKEKLLAQINRNTAETRCNKNIDEPL